jgi:uncharacterized protein (DUF2062 family)
MEPHEWRRSRLGRYLRHIPRPKHLKGTWLHRRLGDQVLDPMLWKPTDHSVAAGFSVGGFFSMMPIPMQMLPAAVLAWFTRCNIPAALVGCWISNPVTAPFLVYLQYQLGRVLLGLGTAPDAEASRSIVELLKTAPLAVLLGAMIMGVVTALVAYPSSYFIWRKIRHAIRTSAESRRRARLAAALGIRKDP